MQVRDSDAVVAEIDRAKDGQDVSGDPKFRLSPAQLFDFELYNPAPATHSLVHLSTKSAPSFRRLLLLRPLDGLCRRPRITRSHMVQHGLETRSALAYGPEQCIVPPALPESDQVVRICAPFVPQRSTGVLARLMHASRVDGLADLFIRPGERVRAVRSSVQSHGGRGSAGYGWRSVT